MSSGWSDIILPGSTGSGAGNFFGDIDLSHFVISSLGGSSSGFVSTNLPVVIINAHGYSKGAASLPVITAAATGIIGAAGNATLLLPSFTLDGRSGAVASVNLKTLTVNATGYSEILGVGGITLPSLVISATGIVVIAGVGTVSLHRLTGKGTGFVGEVATSDISIPVFTLTASGGILPVGIAAITLPTLTVSGEGITAEIISAIITELTTFAISEYTNYSFNSMCKFGNTYLGCSDSGIFSLENSNDNGSAIDAYFELPEFDFDVPNQKRVRKVYLGGKTDGKLKLSITYSRRDVQEYTITSWQEDQVQVGIKTAINRDNKGRYLGFKVENVSGSNFTVDKIDAAITILTKKSRGNYNFGRIILPLLTVAAND